MHANFMTFVVKAGMHSYRQPQYFYFDIISMLYIINDMILIKRLSMENQTRLREKGRNLTQSCDKSPYTHGKVQKAT